LQARNAGQTAEKAVLFASGGNKISRPATLKLPERLKTIAELVPRGRPLFDVGTDHGFLAIYLLLKGVVSRATASDMNAEPLNSARANAEKYGVTDRLSLILCDGLADLEVTEAATIVVAGMGGETIAKILSDAKNKLSGKSCLLILQPMTKAGRLLSSLNALKFNVFDARFVREKTKNYLILLAKS